MITDAKNLAALRSWHALKKLVAQFEGQALEVMAHPDATPEHLLSVHEALVRVRKGMQDSKKNMIKAGVREVPFRGLVI